MTQHEAVLMQLDAEVNIATSSPITIAAMTATMTTIFTPIHSRASTGRTL